MASSLSGEQARTVEILTSQGEYAAAYQYVADSLGPSHGASQWFEMASDINAHSNGMGTTAGGRYTQFFNIAFECDPEDSTRLGLNFLECVLE